MKRSKLIAIVLLASFASIGATYAQEEQGRAEGSCSRFKGSPEGYVAQTERSDAVEWLDCPGYGEPSAAADLASIQPEWRRASLRTGESSRVGRNYGTNAP